MKFTDEELSRVISAHEGGQLRRRGMLWNEVWHIATDGKLAACAIQAGKVIAVQFDAMVMSPRFAMAFDANYYGEWSADLLLAWLESQGVA